VTLRIRCLYKTECIARPHLFGGGPLKTISDVEFVTMAWVDWYDHRRLHGTLGNIPPAEHEATHYAQITAPHPEEQPI
jgi:transposase InsO family protein